ncbi:hypothetical protein MPSEU_000652900 [Mayamaea pseudoterrestris]|nr:hypothetical protein MPSEU_000652900 [Mayamaea pseudoterrestris]
MSGFGSTGFPATPFASPFVASGTGGSSNSFNNPLHQQQQQQSLFGSSSIQYPSFGNQTFGAPSGSLAFGASPHVSQPPPLTFSPAASTSFGESNAATNLSNAAPLSNPFGTSNVNGSYAAPVSQTRPFGTSTTLFGASNSQHQSTIGSSVTVSNNATNAPFSSNAFGNSSFPSQQLSSFENAPLNNGGMAFGMSSNVMAAFSNATSTMNTDNQAQDLDMTASPTPPYGKEADMAAADDVTPIYSAASSFPFGQSTTTFVNGNSVWEHSRQQQTAMPLNAAAPVFTPFAKPSRPHQFDNAQNNTDNEDGDYAANEPTSVGSTELTRLKAKIEEKKRKLLEQKRRKEQSSNNTPPPMSSAAVKSPQRVSLAQRNAIRFAAQPRVNSDNDDNNDHAPVVARVTGAAQANGTTASGIAATEREDLENAVSLVGTCPYMCPEEELRRREAEGDIQLLEIPKPGLLHPEGWTLRETAVKRFRRSAADYKLDVPEWIRPPDVLEHVMSYLEEWVMERDRQGGDPRFPNGGVPPPLDVYQFIWDRTRMIRKDFILQNYVGTGGKCDARAVRCHERIARWHAMCEHQLSHIPDFVKAQSQQNISELGQTLKSLNQFYDDAMNRTLVEVPDEQGRETRTDSHRFAYGCSNDAVQGSNPIDYDGTALVNIADDESRLIGKFAVSRQNHGTAEAEMRGLYILLTIDNDGGMEVLKYVGRLYSEKPEVYHSAPVQLAMSVFTARRECNYARFFSILRSSDTPYLYACLMFKHVELMRKIAFRILSKSYGARNKDFEPIYDAYPLRSLARLLCFESLDEARNACVHYGITVKPKVQSSTGTSADDIIYWRRSIFKEPTDEDKGTVLPLCPQKMVKTIESKLHGATRLAICRGQVRMEENCLNQMVPFAHLPQPSGEVNGGITNHFESINYNNDDHAKTHLTKKMVRGETRESATLEAEEKVCLAEEGKILNDDEASIQQQKVSARTAEIVRLECERQAMKQMEGRRRAAEAERLRITEQAEATRKLEAVEAQVRARRDAEAQAVRDEVARRRREAAAQALLEREEGARRDMEEKARLAAATERRLLEEKRREDKEWESRRHHARRQLITGRWLQYLPPYVLNDSNLDVRSLRLSLDTYEQHERALKLQDAGGAYMRLRRSLEACLKMDAQLPIARWCLESLANSTLIRPRTVLLNIGLLLPSLSHDNSRLVRRWIHSRVRTDRHVCDGLDVRISVQDVGINTEYSVVDATFALNFEGSNIGSQSLEDRLDASRPAVVLKLLSDTEVASEKAAVVNCSDFGPDILEESLRRCFRELTTQLGQIPQTYIERFSLAAVCCMLAQGVVESAQNVELDEELLTHIQLALNILVEYLDEIAKLQDDYAKWPCKTFSFEDKIPCYFSDGHDLPTNWLSVLKRESTAPLVADFSSCLKGSIEDTVNALLSDAAASVRHEKQVLLHRRKNREALLVAFRWRQERTDESPYLYIPNGFLTAILQATVNLAKERIAQTYLPASRIPRLRPSLQGKDDLADVGILMPGTKAADLEHQESVEMPVVRRSEQSSTMRPTLVGPNASKRPFARFQHTNWRTKELARSPKRKRHLLPGSSKTAVSAELGESRIFTSKLEAYLLGTKTSDLHVGSQPLFSYLLGAPNLNHQDI